MFSDKTSKKYNGCERYEYSRCTSHEPDDLYPGYFRLGQDMDVRNTVSHIIDDAHTRHLYTVLVSPELNPQPYEHYFNMSMEHTLHSQMGDAQQTVLKSVFDVVRENMKIGSDRKIARHLASLGVEKDGELVELGSFMMKGVGSDRLLTLTTAAILEQFKDRGIIRGTISVDRNMNRRLDTPDSRTVDHSWVRFTDLSGHVIFLDPSLGFFGTRLLSIVTSSWDHLRPEDIDDPFYEAMALKAMGNIAGESFIPGMLVSASKKVGGAFEKGVGATNQLCVSLGDRARKNPVDGEEAPPNVTTPQ